MRKAVTLAALVALTPCAAGAGEIAGKIGMEYHASGKVISVESGDLNARKPCTLDYARVRVIAAYDGNTLVEVIEPRGSCIAGTMYLSTWAKAAGQVAEWEYRPTRILRKALGLDGCAPPRTVCPQLTEGE